MEFQQQDEEMINNHVGKMSNNTNNNNSNNNNNNNYYLCRQSSTRWTPTTEQIKLLKDLYYLQGIRSPTADQIQSICARLRRYGKIEGKNVFYWFQNHKARERQKKKLTPTSPNNNNNNNNFIRNNNNNNNGNINTFHAKYPCSFNNNPGISCSSSTAGVISGSGQLMGSFGYGAVTMENKFRDCSISGGGIPIPNGGNQWSNYFNPNNPTSYSNFFIDKVSSNVDHHHHHHPYINHHDHHHHHHDHDHDHYGPQSPHEIQTLPLFPMHNDHHDRDHDHDLDLDLDHDQGFYTYKPQSDGCNYTGGYRWSSNVNGGHTSLELSLNSYGFGCYSPN